MNNINKLESKQVSDYIVDDKRSSFFINGFQTITFNNTEIKNKLFDRCYEINNNNKLNGYKWDEIYKSTEDFGPKPYKENLYIDFIFDQGIHTLIEELTGFDLYLGDFAIRRTYPNKKSYMRWHRDTHFYKNKKIIGRMPPIYKLIVYVPESEGLYSDQLRISPGSQHRFIENRYLDIIYAMLRKKVTVTSSDINCIFLNSMVHHSVIQNIQVKKPSVRLFYNFCLKSQLSEFKGREDLHQIYINKKNNHINKKFLN